MSEYPSALTKIEERRSGLGQAFGRLHQALSEIEEYHCGKIAKGQTPRFRFLIQEQVVTCSLGVFINVGAEFDEVDSDSILPSTELQNLLTELCAEIGLRRVKHNSTVNMDTGRTRHTEVHYQYGPSHSTNPTKTPTSEAVPSTFSH